MLKKIAFAFIAALVLVNASGALTQPANASPNTEQTWAQHTKDWAQGPGGAAGNYEYSCQ